MSEWNTAGKVRTTPKGTHSSLVPYEVLDLVSNGSKTQYYIAKQNVPAGVNLENTAYWDVVMDVSEADAGALEDLRQYVREISPAKTVGPSGIVGVDDAAQLSAENVEIEIKPNQDLHGYEYPWPAGGGKNLINDSIKYQASASVLDIGTNNAYTIPLKAGTYTLTIQFLNNVHYGAYYREQNGSANTTIWASDTADTSKTFTISTDGLYRVWVYHANGVDEANIGQVQLEAGSSSTSYAPYSNVCPISGWTGIEVTRTGKNLLNPEQYGQTLPYTTHGVTITKVSNGVYHMEGTSDAQTYWNLTFKDNENIGNAMPAAPFIGKNMYLSVIGAPDIVPYLNYFKSDGTIASIVNGTVIPASAAAIRCFLMIPSGTTINSNFSVQLELSTTATPYEPYQTPTTYNISLPSEAGTVYGGTLDVTNGTLVVDKTYLTLNTSNMDNSEDYPGWGNSGAKAILGEGLNKKFTTTEDGISVNIGTAIGVNTRDGRDIIYLPKAEYDNWVQTEWKALALDVQIVLPLTTTVTYTLSSQEIDLLRGCNTLWTSAGNTELTYRQDVATLLAKLSTQVVALNTAVANS